MPFLGFKACLASSVTASLWQKLFPIPLESLLPVSMTTDEKSVRIIQVDKALPSDALVIGIPFAQRNGFRKDSSGRQLGVGPSDQYQVVIDTVAALARALPGSKLVASGAHAPPGPYGGRVAEWESAKKTWLGRGVDASRIIEERTSVDTFQQSYIYSKLAHRSRQRQAVLVVNFYQAHRALELCQRADPTIKWRVVPVLHHNWSDQAKVPLRWRNVFLLREAVLNILLGIFPNLKAE